METKYYVDAWGKYLGGFSAGNPAIPAGAIEVPNAPNTASDVWVNAEWIPPSPTLKDYDIAIERHLDAGAKEAGYYDPLDRIPNIDRACSYASFDNPYQAEGQSFVAWRAAVWGYVYQVKQDVDAELRTQPTIDELLDELPDRQIG